MKTFDIAIIGSGASGCMCAITAAPSGKKIALIDKNKLPARKLMATGNGRCNLTNITCTPSIKFYNQNIDKYLKRFSQHDALSFFESLGLVWQADSEGRVYPLSGMAKSVIDVINNSLEKYDNISILGEKTVENIEKTGQNFKISLVNDEIITKKLVVASGGNSNVLLENLGVNCKKLCPSLSALKTEKIPKLLNNIRVSPVKITAITSQGKSYSEVGEVLFKENGLSGIAIFNASAFFSREKEFKGKIFIDLMPNIDLNSLIGLLSNRRKIDIKVSKFFDGLCANQLGYYILEKCNIDENRSCIKLKDGEIKSLANSIKNLEFNVNGNYENNQVFSGGAKLENLSENLESKNCKNLFICGEACDVDGICGGFNLQWAWTSGYIVGKAL